PAGATGTVTGAAVAGSVTPTPSSRRSRPRSTNRLLAPAVGHHAVEALPSMPLAAGAAACDELAVADPPRATSTLSVEEGSRPSHAIAGAASGGADAVARKAAQIAGT